MPIDFTKAPSCYWSKIEQVSYLQRKVIVHSILYYELNKPIITDSEFDELAIQCATMQKELTIEEFNKTRYNYCMEGFDGTTGFKLYSKLNSKDKDYLMNIANMLLREVKHD